MSAIQIGNSPHLVTLTTIKYREAPAMGSAQAHLPSRLPSTFAAKCQHPIRSSSKLVPCASDGHSDGLSSSNCLVSERLEREPKDAYITHQHFIEKQLEKRKTLREAHRRWQEAEWSDTRRQHSRQGFGRAAHRPSYPLLSRVPGLTITGIPRSVELRLGPTRRKRVRFDDSQDHRPEDQYRSDSCFARSLSEYAPGRWADATGQGYENTSDPYGEDTELEEDDGDGDDEFANLSLEELDALEKSVAARIAELERQEQEQDEDVDPDPVALN